MVKASQNASPKVAASGIVRSSAPPLRMMMTGVKMPIQMRIVPIPMPREAMFAALRDGTVDMVVAQTTITPERLRLVDFTNPTRSGVNEVVVTGPGGPALKSLDDLAGQRIGVQSGTTGELYVTDNAPSSADVMPLEDAAAMEEALTTRAVGAAVYDNTVVGDVVANNPALEVSAEFDTGEQYGMAVKKNGNVDLLRSINKVLATLEENGGYDKIYASWFGRPRE